MGRGGAERKGDRESQVGSALPAWILMWAFNGQTRRSWPELKSRVRGLTGWPNQVPLNRNFLFSFLFFFFFNMKSIVILVSIQHPVLVPTGASCCCQGHIWLFYLKLVMVSCNGGGSSFILLLPRKWLLLKCPHPRTEGNRLKRMVKRHHIAMKRGIRRNLNSHS